MDSKYWIVVKTGQAEVRALENLSNDIVSKTLPLIELTRGRKITKNGIEAYPFDNRLSKIKETYQGHTVAIDVTSDEALSSPETDYLYSPESGYKNWIDFLLQLKGENVFKKIIPTILFNFEDKDFDNNIIQQIQLLKANFDTILYRNNIADNNCYEDIELIYEEINDDNFIILIDCDYIPQASHKNVSEKCIARINNIKNILGAASCKYIVSSTSFPNNVRDLGDLKTDTFSISEIEMFNSIRQTHNDIIYADYASINPIRNDTIRMARGWIPRIDVPLKTEIFYYKERRPKGVTAYASTYIQVARYVCSDDRFPNYLSKNWGVSQIRACAQGNSPAASPSFWISVRMNIHIEQQVRRIYSISNDEERRHKSSI